MQQVQLGSGLAITNIAVSPAVPALKTPFNVTGLVQLAGRTFEGPLWVEVVLQQGSKVITRGSSMAVGGGFTVGFSGVGVGTYSINVNGYPGPVFHLGGKLPLPPLFPSFLGFLIPSTPTVTIPPTPPLVTATASLTVIDETWPSLSAVFEGGVTLIPKANGETCAATVYFTHQGETMDVDVGMIVDTPVPTVAFQTVTVGNDATPTNYQVQVSGIFNTTNLGANRRVGVILFIQTHGGRIALGASFLGTADYANVYFVSVPSFSSLLGTLNGGGTLIPKHNGETFTAKITFMHTGAGGDFAVGIALNYTPTPTWAYQTITLSDDPNPQQYTVNVSGTFETNLGPNKRINVLVFIQTSDGPLTWGATFPAQYQITAGYYVSSPQFQNLTPTYY